MKAFLELRRICPFICALLVLLVVVGQLSAEVEVKELEDRIEVTIDHQIFTAWRHKDWAAPYLYPVIGPNRESLTRHLPMQTGMPGEEQDHPWHRSIRFSHSDVNGFNFWWAPGQEKAGHTAEVKLEKIEKVFSGKTGEVILWNQWLGNGKLVLRERVRLAFTPLENRQVLMDYDTELQAGEAPVIFGDKRDGGLLVRVAGTMKVEDEKGNKGQGAILNSRGDKNAEAWGKRAEWADYFGPDASGKTVGIAIFDHPSNLRFPTHWHARTYGLMTANRFGTDHFKGNYGDHKTVICAPSKGANCPACASHSGDYTIPAGKSIALRNRFYFHHGDPQAAKVAEQYHAYAADKSSVISRARALMQDRRWKDAIAILEREAPAAWPADSAPEAVEALRLRGQAYSFAKDGAQAEADYKAALKLAPKDETLWLSLADNYTNNLNDDDQALAAYRQAFELSGTRRMGWQPLTATVAMARILTDQLKTDEALEALQPYTNLSEVAPIWRIKLLRAYGHIYAAQGKEQESLASFREALQMEAFKVNPGPEYQSRARLYQGVPTIARDKSGRLWAAWFAGGRDESNDNYVVVVTSHDDGATWTEPVLVIDPLGSARTFDPCLWTAPDGRLFLFYAQANPTTGIHDGRWGVWFTICETPGLANSGWKQPVRICDGIMLNKPTILNNGAWLLPVANWADKSRGAGVIRSRDEGRSFEFIGGAPGRSLEGVNGAAGGGMEHIIIERKDGTLWMPMRIKDGLAESTSQDGGATWSQPVRSPIEGPGARFHVRRLRSGRLLMVNHVGFSREVPVIAQRSHLTALLSDDDGKSWPHRLLLDERIQVSYPDVVETPDGKLYIIYDRGRTSDREILMAVTSETDILAGQAGSATKLRLLINKATGPR